MLGTLASAVMVVFGALFLGQAAIRLCGATAWTWLAAPAGAALMMLIAVPALHFPGRSAGTAMVLGLMLVAAGVILVREGAQLPPATGLLAAIPVALLTVLPFAAAGRSGTLGWSFNNDMASHLLLAEGYRSQAVADIHALLPDYPLGPHALAATLSELLGVRVDQSFAGLTMAIPVLLGLTALAVLRRPRWWGRTVTVTLVGMPFLVAGYFGQGSFKELYQALFTFGVAVWLAAPPAQRAPLRWVPVALILAGTLSVHSLLGLAWPLAFLGLWLAGRVVTTLTARRGAAALLADARRGLIGVGVGVAALFLVIVPQLPRLLSFVANRAGASAGIAKDDIGNLARAASRCGRPSGSGATPITGCPASPRSPTGCGPRSR